MLSYFLMAVLFVAGIVSCSGMILQVLSNSINDQELGSQPEIFNSSTWYPTSSLAADWLTLCGSESGQFIYGSTAADGMIYSADFGLTWSVQETTLSMKKSKGVFCSGSGAVLIDIDTDGTQISSNYGQTWSYLPVERNGPLLPHLWSSVAVSDDGQYIYGVQWSKAVFGSIDFGKTFISIFGDRMRTPGSIIQCSGTGQFVLVTEYFYGCVSLSSDFGASFNRTTVPCLNHLGHYALTVSSTGQYMTAHSADGKTSVSTDYGLSWSTISHSPVVFSSVKTSRSGHVLAAIREQDSSRLMPQKYSIYVSTDCGRNWSETALTAGKYVVVSVSGDGKRITAGQGGYPLVVTNTGEFDSESSETTLPLDTPVPTAESTLSPSPVANNSNSSNSSALNDEWEVLVDTPPAVWNSVAVSLSGQFIFAGTTFTGMYRSADFGATWELSTDTTAAAIESNGRNHQGYSKGVFCSGSGEKVVFMNTNSALLSNNFGESFAPLPDGAHSGDWSDVALSGSGQYVYATISCGYIYSSADFGVTWVNYYPLKGWSGAQIGCSGDGRIVVSIHCYYGTIVVSTDYGANWTDTKYSVPIGEYTALTVSSSGQYMAISLKSGGFVLSKDFGTVWLTALFSGVYFNSLAVDASGQHYVGTRYGQSGRVLLSDNYGFTWPTERSDSTSSSPPLSPVAQWSAVGVSGTGDVMVLAGPGHSLLRWRNSNNTYEPLTTMPSSEPTVNIGQSIAPSSATTVPPTCTTSSPTVATQAPTASTTNSTSSDSSGESSLSAASQPSKSSSFVYVPHLIVTAVVISVLFLSVVAFHYCRHHTQHLTQHSTIIGGDNKTSTKSREMSRPYTKLATEEEVEGVEMSNHIHRKNKKNNNTGNRNTHSTVMESSDDEMEYEIL